MLERAAGDDCRECYECVSIRRIVMEQYLWAELDHIFVGRLVVYHLLQPLPSYAPANTGLYTCHEISVATDHEHSHAYLARKTPLLFQPLSSPLFPAHETMTARAGTHYPR